ncbi:hypothetical protein SADUNF_Sadunf01G0171900 [Salix dunnii]|uniref:Protein RETICULATA-RELATED 1, chloroplastic n=1 Tax=Salix dunnii TaxID=1413687 RepID=A0A835TL01_9ROSI|nr:hypothetical protein SADUNF_Sadunf01G0171900 [Salix dunnii]
MSHFVFHTTQIPATTTKTTLTLKPSSPIPQLCHLRNTRKRVNHNHTIKCSSSSSSSSSCPTIDGGGDSVAGLERCFLAPPAPALNSSPKGDFGPVMKGKFGSLGSVTLEKSKLDLTQKQSQSTPELFDRKFVDAVLNEWHKTVMDLPAGFRQAYEMGLVSSAQMVKFLAINARPTTTRFISRALPEAISRAFIGRALPENLMLCKAGDSLVLIKMLADPAFLYRLLLEQAATLGCSVWWELKNRKDRIKQEWDLALINVLTVTACNAFVVWTLAPCRSYGNTFQFDLQNTLQKLPNNIFEMSYPLREFDLQKRIHSFFYKAAELCLVGLTAGAIQGSLTNILARKKDKLSVTVPPVSTYALGYGAFLGLYANLRYQLSFGFDRAVVSHFDVIGVALFFSTALRILNTQVGETSRLAWLGVEADPLVQSDDLLKAYNRSPSADADSSSSKWFISKKTLVSGLGLLGIKQGTTDSINGESPASKVRRKRVVRKKVSPS